MQAVAYLRVLQLADVAVYVQYEVVEVVRYLMHIQVFVQPRLLHDLPYLLPQHRKFLRVHPLRPRVLVHQLLAARDVAVAIGGGHRGHKVVDDDGVAAPLSLRAFAGVVDDERVEVRNVRQADLGYAGARKAHAFARRPFQRAVLAEVYYCVRAESVTQPAVKRDVVMRGH